MQNKSAYLEKTITLPGMPRLKISARYASVEPAFVNDIQGFVQYYCLGGKVPVLVEIWEDVESTQGIKSPPDSSLTEVWGWFAYCGGMDLTSCGPKLPAGCIKVLADSRFGFIDGGSGLDEGSNELVRAISEVVNYFYKLS